MLSELLAQNLADHPEKRRDFDRLTGRIALVVDDIDVSITLCFEAGRLTVHGGIYGMPDVTITASSDDIMKMSLMELVPKVGLPDPRGQFTREIFSASQGGKIHMHGALLHMPLMLRLTRVMSINR